MNTDKAPFMFFWIYCDTLKCKPMFSPRCPSAESLPRRVFMTTGGKGLLADEEQRLFRLRQEKEEQVQREISKQRQMFEREAKDGQLDKLCATPFGVDVVGITEFIALTGALVGGTPSPLHLPQWQVGSDMPSIQLGAYRLIRKGTAYCDSPCADKRSLKISGADCDKFCAQAHL